MTTNIEAAQRERWQKVRAKGKTSYILKWGVLCWGLPMFVIMAGLDFYRHRISFGLELIGYIAFAFVIWIAGGYTFGLFQWNRYEKRFGPNSSQQRPS